MIMKQGYFPVLILLLMMAGCSGNRDFEQVHTFSDATWHRFDILSFDLPIKKAMDEYNIQVVIRHNEDLEHARIPFHFIMTFPGGEERIWEQTLVIRNADGSFTGAQKDGSYEILVPIRSRMRFREAGNCNITVEQIIPKYNTQGIVSFGMRLTLN